MQLKCKRFSLYLTQKKMFRNTRVPQIVQQSRGEMRERGMCVGGNLITGLKKANVQFVFFLCRLNALTAACTA